MTFCGSLRISVELPREIITCIYVNLEKICLELLACEIAYLSLFYEAPHGLQLAFFLAHGFVVQVFSGSDVVPLFRRV